MKDAGSHVPSRSSLDTGCSLPPRQSLTMLQPLFTVHSLRSAQLGEDCSYRKMSWPPRGGTPRSSRARSTTSSAESALLSVSRARQAFWKTLNTTLLSSMRCVCAAKRSASCAASLLSRAAVQPAMAALPLGRRAR